MQFRRQLVIATNAVLYMNVRIFFLWRHQKFLFENQKLHLNVSTFFSLCVNQNMVIAEVYYKLIQLSNEPIGYSYSHCTVYEYE